MSKRRKLSGDFKARVALEGAPGFISFALWQATDAVTLQTAVQGRAGHFRNTGLQSEQAIIQRQQGVAANRDDCGLFCDGEHRRTYLLRPHRGIFHGISFAPLGNGFDVDPQSPGHAAFEAFDRCISARTACVVLALP